MNKIINLDPEWIVGFTDAEGHFSVIQNRNTVRCRFFISQDVRSIHVLYEIQSFFGVGKVHATGGTMFAYTVEESRALDSVIIPFFEKHTLQTQKYYDWLKFKYAVQSKVSKRKITKSDVDRIDGDCRTQPIPSRPLTAGWFIGFADGESCFTVSIVKKAVMPQFIIGLHRRDRAICERIQSFLNCGIVYTRKSGVVVFQISKLEALITRFRPLFYIAGRFHTLRTHKRRRASFFWRIIHYMQEGLHRNSKGLNQIKHWKEKMRFPKKIQEEDQVRPLA